MRNMKKFAPDRVQNQPTPESARIDTEREALLLEVNEALENMQPDALERLYILMLLRLDGENRPEPE